MARYLLNNFCTWNECITMLFLNSLLPSYIQYLTLHLSKTYLLMLFYFNWIKGVVIPEPKVFVITLHPLSSRWSSLSVSIRFEHCHLFLFNYRNQLTQTWKECYLDGFQHYFYALVAGHSENKFLPMSVHKSN